MVGHNLLWSCIKIGKIIIISKKNETVFHLELLYPYPYVSKEFKNNLLIHFLYFTKRHEKKLVKFNPVVFVLFFCVETISEYLPCLLWI